MNRIYLDHNATTPPAPEVVERLTRHVVALEPNRQRIDRALDRAHRKRRAPHVLHRDEPAPGPQHPEHLTDRGLVSVKGDHLVLLIEKNGIAARLAGRCQLALLAVTLGA